VKLDSIVGVASGQTLRFSGGLFVLLLLLALAGCRTDLTPCESDADCVIFCECANRDGTLTIGPYACRAGTCGAAHAEDRDCVRACSNPPPVFPDDDDSGLDDDDSSGD